MRASYCHIVHYTVSHRSPAMLCLLVIFRQFTKIVTKLHILVFYYILCIIRFGWFYSHFMKTSKFLLRSYNHVLFINTNFCRKKNHKTALFNFSGGSYVRRINVNGSYSELWHLHNILTKIYVLRIKISNIRLTILCA